MAKNIYYGLKSEVAFSFKTTKNGSIAPEITTSDASLAKWYSTDGQSVIDNNIGAFTFPDDTEKTITVIIDCRKITTMDSFNGIDLTYINIQRLTGLVQRIYLSDNPNLLTVFNPIVVGGITDAIYDNTNIDILDLSQTIIADADISFLNAINMHRFMQPQLFWSAASFTLDKSIVFDTLDISNGYLKGAIAITNSDFIEGINFKNNITYQYVQSMDLSNNRLLKTIDFNIMQNLLTPANSWIKAQNIGADQNQVDSMLAALNNVVSSGAAGREIYLDGNTAPSSAGLHSKLLLELKGLTVIVDP